MMRPSAYTALKLVCALCFFIFSCEFDPSTRWYPPPPTPPPPPECEVGKQRCTVTALQDCQTDANGVPQWVDTEDCAAQGKVCAPSLLACTECIPDSYGCDGLDVVRCSLDGQTKTILETCVPDTGHACRNGVCQQLCKNAEEVRSNVGCEYWAVDLDNAMIDTTKNAAGQQYAVVVSNPQPDVAVTVQIEQDDGVVGGPAAPVEIAQAVIAPLNLRVFKLGPREVDGSPNGEFNTGTHSALTRQAYKVTTNFPVVVYQFNPLENVNVFSNDASLLKPREALTYNTAGNTTLSYVVAGWPQTIAITDDPDTNFSSANPIHLRAFLTIVGTQADTEVIVHTAADIVGGGAVPETAVGKKLSQTLDPFDVLNLETADFNADFTGTIIESNKPIAVFSGGEASDAPQFATLLERRCCADHLEEQLDPVRTAGKTFALIHSPSRTTTIKTAGGDLGVAPEPDYFRFVATTETSTTITTTLPPPDDQFTLYGVGAWRELSTTHDFLAESDEPIHVVQVTASQDAANVPRNLPGGDPSMLVVPPREQFRPDYVFLTPDKYAFDFVMIAAPPEVPVNLDGTVLSEQHCEITAADGLTKEQRGGSAPELLAYRCQLGFATVNPDTGEILPGVQNDGVHRISAPIPIGVAVFGFDAYVSYAYAAGTELKDIAPPK